MKQDSGLDIVEVDEMRHVAAQVAASVPELMSRSVQEQRCDDVRPLSAVSFHQPERDLEEQRRCR
jgi:hypothetical protein